MIDGEYRAGIDEAYRRLGLEPLDAHMAEVRAFNLHNNKLKKTEEYKGIGATTWMCVQSAILLIRGQEVAIIERSDLMAMMMFTNINKAVEQLDPIVKLFHTETGNYEYNNGAVLRIRSSPTVCRGKVFYDSEWKDKAIQRLQGPFAMMAEIRYKDGLFSAYADDNEYLMDLHVSSVLEFRKKGIPVVGADIFEPPEGGIIIEDPEITPWEDFDPEVDENELLRVLHQVDDALEKCSNEMDQAALCGCGDSANHPHDGNHHGMAQGNYKTAAELALAVLPLIEHTIFSNSRH